MIDTPIPLRDKAAQRPDPAVEDSRNDHAAANQSTADDKAERASEGSQAEAPGGEQATVNVTAPDTREFYIIPIPRWVRYHSQDPPTFTVTRNIIFGVIGTFTVANLYYVQPLLIDLSKHFNVTYQTVSRLPTLTQAGYASGLLLITPTGDLLKRRQLMMVCISVSLFVCIALAATTEYAVFEAFSFLIGITSVTPQILMPLAIDLARPEQRATAMATVLSAMLLGIMGARLVAGIIAQYSSFREVYYMAAGLQALMLTLVYTYVPDYPKKNAHLSYFQIIRSMLVYAVTEPILIQGCLISTLASSLFANFWVTLTFLLGSDPYNYNTLQIGLFGLLGCFAVCSAPLVGRLVDRLVPWVGIFFGLTSLALGAAVYTAAAGKSLAGIIITCFLLDIGNQLQQVAIGTRNRLIEPSAFSRLNSVYIIFLFIGQILGTQAGSRVFLTRGFRINGVLCLGLISAAFIVLMLRGPCEPRNVWLGWRHGKEMRKSRISAQPEKSEQEQIKTQNTLVGEEVKGDV